ncbi:MAG: ATP-binding protein, partial [Alphaproteobacteria bacterium]|nr:ATP-binding protein [Alphaproteobacteria bacterium]
MATNSVIKSTSSIRKGNAARHSKTLPAYFLSLSVENARCFGPKQELDLSNESGGPARWTVILGDNGTGKTTLLQCLVAMQPSYGFFRLPERLFPRAMPLVTLVSVRKEVDSLESFVILYWPPIRFSG